MEECKFQKGDEVEVKDSNEDYWKNDFLFLAYNQDNPSQEYYVVTDTEGYVSSYQQCRYPKPDLKLDDPVWVRCRNDHKWRRMHFKAWRADTIEVWIEGKTSHSSISKYGCVYTEYSISNPIPEPEPF